MTTLCDAYYEEGPCSKNGAHSTCKNHTDLDSGKTEEKGAPANNMEENGTRTDEECCYWFG